MFEELSNCRICNSNQLDTVLDLGMIYPSGFVKTQEGLTKAPLKLVKCKDCGLVQLSHTVDLDLMYRQYWYSSALNSSMVRSLQEVTESIESMIKFEPDDLVVDIGANDCTLFNQYVDKASLVKIGFDPSLNLRERAEKNCDIFINEYFDTKYSPEKLLTEKAKVITAIAMFYDLPDPNWFVREVKKVLRSDGMFVVQFTDLKSMVELNAFDNICHEHLEYYSLQDVTNLLKSNGLAVFHIEHNDVNGGSLRIYSSFPGVFAEDKTVNYFIEDEINFFKQGNFDRFVKDIENNKLLLYNFIKVMSEVGKTFYVLGASTKGNTLLQYFCINDEMIPYAMEVNSDKFGLKTVGSNIEIIPESKDNRPDYFLVLPWHFIKNLTKSLDWFLEDGGILLTPLPYLATYTKVDNMIIKTEIKIVS